MAYQEITDDSNLVATCRVCNRLAGSRLFDNFDAKKAYILERRKNGKARPMGDIYIRAAPPVKPVRIEGFTPSITGDDLYNLRIEMGISVSALCRALSRSIDPGATRGFSRVYIHQMMSGSREITPTIEKAYFELKKSYELMKRSAEEEGWILTKMVAPCLFPYALLGEGAKFALCECGNIYLKSTHNQKRCGKNCGKPNAGYLTWAHKEQQMTPVYVVPVVARRINLLHWIQIINHDMNITFELASIKRRVQCAG